MKKDFWLERWERAETGFHQNEINPYLQRHWQELHHAQGGEVFVPLCGKSLDMIWLREQGCSPLGVEISPIAVQSFYKENGYSPELVAGNKFERYEAGGIKILCGDFFDLGKKELANVRAVYDRASLVALPPEMRERYAQHLASILSAGTQILLITFDYPQAEMSGPPFAVSIEEVESLYRDRAEIRLLAHHDVLAQTPRFKERGLSRLHENIFLLTLR
ncbi:thiopurine S-methyltransferase [Sideroxydans lithotrophicus]|uniref:Thiopurine S-methyltransferase n=1 Tax=Sideroxydans lithotrophicus (strain ES-1) TaxID=580332 RepID=D5CQZ6_SIDLE|nr:thiopurine S-methyltransferase [Sideroxydans lithotrophicus]ADE11382.1 Thiopurine S-methyltransferase [Sideroxydans lithotrophicus ES-1]